MHDPKKIQLGSPLLVTEASPRDVLRSLWVGRKQELQLLYDHFNRRGPRQAVITGQRGSGKTALAYMFREQSEPANLFPGGWLHVHATPFPNIVPEIVPEFFSRARRGTRSLLFVDDYNVGSGAFRSVLWSSLAHNPSPDLLICSDGEVPREMKEPLVVQLGGLTRTEFLELIQRRVTFSGTDEAQAQKLFELVAGEPLYADLAGKTIREHLFTLHEFVNGLRSFARSGIVGPDGEPLPRIPKPFKLVTGDTNQILRERLRADPGGLYSLEPRQFEELIADLLRERGYEITLTPPSKDGGFDMFAARRDDLGSFLYLVECKRFTPPHKVGVSIVRSLHGVVQQKQANAGIIITSTFFTRGAKAFEESVPYQLQLRDYLALQKWLGVI